MPLVVKFGITFAVLWLFFGLLYREADRWSLLEKVAGVICGLSFLGAIATAIVWVWSA